MQMITELSKDPNQFNLNYQTVGSGKSLILLHGFGLNRTIWDQVISYLPPNIQVLTPDLRGHGKSFVPSGIYRMEEMAEDILRLMNHLAIEKAVLAGHSMGGYIALAFAQNYPERLESLALITTNARPDAPEKRNARIIDMHKVEQLGSNVIAENLAPRLSQDPILVNAMQMIINSTDPQGIVGSGLGMADRPDRMNVLATLNVPLLVVAGSDDLITPLSACEEMALVAPSGKLVVMNGVGHLPMLEAPLRLSEELCKLVNKIGY